MTPNFYSGEFRDTPTPLVITDEDIEHLMMSFGNKQLAAMYDNLPGILSTNKILQSYYPSGSNNMIVTMQVQNFLDAMYSPFASIWADDKAFENMKGTVFFRFWRDVCEQLSAEQFALCFDNAPQDPRGAILKAFMQKLVAAYPNELNISVDVSTQVPVKKSNIIEIATVSQFANDAGESLATGLAKVFANNSHFVRAYAHIASARLWKMIAQQLQCASQDKDRLSAPLLLAVLADIRDYATDTEFASCFATDQDPTGLWFKHFVSQLFLDFYYQNILDKRKLQSQIGDTLQQTRPDDTNSSGTHFIAL